ncbi:MtN3-like protein [Phytophthora cinnamomi]|uniref:MtN3-like protein n=1 Tax=Phytophthora cinnamomi TaxID=4785 RepID=UPI003559707F|nr:MtN3-like protein [Phytophthora cinnamomi]
MGVGLTIIQVLASLCSVAMIVSSVPAMYRIHKLKDVGEVALVPLVGLWINCHVLMLYGWATADYFPLFATYLFGDVMSVLYIGVYFRWTKQRSYALKVIGASFFVVVLTATYTILGITGVTGQSTDQVGLVTGYFMAVGSVLLYISPFETIKTVLKTRSGASIPFGMCLAGATSNVLWMFNGLLTSDIFVFLLGTVCAALGFMQVVLYLVYRPGRGGAAVEQTSPEMKFVLPVTASPKSGNLPSPVFIAVQTP